MKWVKAIDRFPEHGNPESLSNVIFRQISDKSQIPNCIWAYHSTHIELENYPGRCGASIYYDDIEWLLEDES